MQAIAVANRRLSGHLVASSDLVPTKIKMTDPSHQISQLKIDRTTPTAAANRRIWLAMPLLAVVLAGGGWLLLRGPAGSVAVETETARKPPSLAAAGSVLDASGYVVARREATVSSKLTGKVSEILVEEGMRVEAGQVIARLDDATQHAQLALAEAQVGSARATVQETEALLRGAGQERDRLRDLAARKLTSVASLDAAESSYDSLAARLEVGREDVKVAERGVAIARDALDNMTIRAPFGGMVVSKNAQPGEMISPVSAGGGFTRTGICTIVDMDSLEIEVDVNEAYIQRVLPGQPVSATLDAYPDWQIPADVIAIVPTADRQKATVRVRIGFRQKDPRILRDMGVKVAFLGIDSKTEPQQVAQGVLISRNAVHQDESGDFVWRVSSTGTIERRSVTLGGPNDRDPVLISDGLAAGDTIVRSSEESLSAGQKIKE
jgi:RND family efflux transporter MFP subunit